MNLHLCKKPLPANILEKYTHREVYRIAPFPSNSGDSYLLRLNPSVHSLDLPEHYIMIDLSEEDILYLILMDCYVVEVKDKRINCTEQLLSALYRNLSKPGTTGS